MTLPDRRSIPHYSSNAVFQAGHAGSIHVATAPSSKTRSAARDTAVFPSLMEGFTPDVPDHGLIVSTRVLA